MYYLKYFFTFLILRTRRIHSGFSINISAISCETWSLVFRKQFSLFFSKFILSSVKTQAKVAEHCMLSAHAVTHTFIHLISKNALRAKVNLIYSRYLEKKWNSFQCSLIFLSMLSFHDPYQAEVATRGVL